jgi:hypothetical protein
MISKEYLEKFKSLYKKKYDIVLSEEEAVEMATAFLNLMKVLIHPNPKSTNNQSTMQKERQNEINGI